MIGYWFRKLADAIEGEAHRLDSEDAERHAQAAEVVASWGGKPSPRRTPDDVRLLRLIVGALRKVGADA